MKAFVKTGAHLGNSYHNCRRTEVIFFVQVIAFSYHYNFHKEMANMQGHWEN